MSDKVMRVAIKFVDLVLKHDWQKIEELPDNEIQILFDIVSSARFELKEIIHGHYRDQDSDTGEIYLINSLCLLKVIYNKDNEDKDHYFATGWLDCAMRRAHSGHSRQP